MILGKIKYKLKNFFKCSYLSNYLYFKLKNVEIGKGVKIHGKLFLSIQKRSLYIGDNCIFNSGIETNPLGGMNQCRFITYGNGKIHIGNNVGISNSCINSHINITIQDNVNIGGDCKIYDSDFHSINFDDRITLPDKKYQSKEVLIKNGVWIGAHSIILKGVTIGERSVIGAGSVVAKNIPPDEIWAGNPAKFIKKINNLEEN